MRPLCWCFGDFRLDAANACLWRGEERLTLRPKTFEILMYLVTHADELVTKEALLNEIWPDTAIGDGVLKTSIRDLRRILGEKARTPQFIATEHRRGYRFIAPVTIVDAGHVPPADSEPPPQPTQRPHVAQSHIEPHLPTHLVARETELARLHQGFAAACNRESQLIFVTGEAGIGKTALVDAFLAQVTTSEAVWVGQGQCVEQYGTREAYLPLLEILRQLCRGPHGDQVLERLYREAPSWLLQMPALLPTGGYQVLQQQYGGATQDRMLRELAEAIESLTATSPLLLVLEDLHWSDTATIDWLNFMGHRRVQARLLVIATYRPMDAMQQAHSIDRIAQDLQRRGQAFELPLDYLTDAGVSAYLHQRFEKHTFPEPLIQILAQHTSGNPFFLITVVDELIRQGRFAQEGSHWTFAGDIDAVGRSLPHRVQYLIESQLEQLSPQEQTLLAAASVAGIEFTATAVAALLGDEAEHVEGQCDVLARRGQFMAPRGVVEWPNRTISAQYQFLHGLYHQVVYERVPVSRQVRWHQHMGDYLEAIYGGQTQEMAAALAEHFVRGRDAERALHYLYLAGEQSLQRSAYEEAKAHFTRGLDLLPYLPESPERDRLEIRLRTGIGPVLMAASSYGSPEVVDNYTRAHELYQGGGQTAEAFPVVWGLWQISNAREKPHIALEVAKQAYTIAKASKDPIQQTQGHHAMWSTLMHCGRYEEALQHVEQGKGLYQPRHHHLHAAGYGVDDPGVCCRTTGADALWYLGYFDQALEWAKEGVALAKTLEHPFSLSYALSTLLDRYRDRRDFEKTYECHDAIMAVCTEHGFQSTLALAEMEWGYTLILQQQFEAAIERIHNGLEMFKSMGILFQRPWVRRYLAMAYGRLGRIDEAMAEIQHGLQSLGDSIHKAAPELHRIKGILHLLEAVPNEQEAAACFQRALGLARHLKALPLELRAALELAQLWVKQGQRSEALLLLEPIYDRFTEGYGAGDLQRARQVLQDLGRP